jgi:hypothetical protein
MSRYALLLCGAFPIFCGCAAVSLDARDVANTRISQIAPDDNVECAGEAQAYAHSHALDCEKATLWMVQERKLNSRLSDAGLTEPNQIADVWISSNDNGLQLNVRTLDKEVVSKVSKIAEESNVSLVVEKQDAIVFIRTAESTSKFEMISGLCPNIQGFYIDVKTGHLMLDVLSTEETKSQNEIDEIEKEISDTLGFPARIVLGADIFGDA